MEPKKSIKADLESKKGIFFEIGLVVVLAIVLIAFEWSTKPNMQNTLGELADLDLEEEIIPITRQQDVKPPPPPPPPTVSEVLKIVEDDIEIENELVITDAEADQNMEIDIMAFEEEEEAAEEEIFIIVEDMPSFQGQGQEGFRTWITKNMKYPEIAAENGISGTVYIRFVVNAQGEVEDAVVLRGVDPALDREAIRVVMSSPRWTPGKQRGKPVKVQFNFPINFVLN